jgi:hypothetical protein
MSESGRYCCKSCFAENVKNFQGLVSGESFAVDASLIKADATGGFLQLSVWRWVPLCRARLSVTHDILVEKCVSPALPAEIDGPGAIGCGTIGFREERGDQAEECGRNLR